MTRQKIKWVFEWVFGLAINFIRDVPERKKLTSSCKYCWHFYERQFFLPQFRATLYLREICTRMWSLPSFVAATFQNQNKYKFPFHIRPWWLLVPRVFETTSCTLCGISTIASSVPLLPNIVPSSPPYSRRWRIVFQWTASDTSQKYQSLQEGVGDDMVVMGEGFFAGRAWLFHCQLVAVDVYTLSPTSVPEQCSLCSTSLDPVDSLPAVAADGHLFLLASSHPVAS